MLLSQEIKLRYRILFLNAQLSMIIIYVFLATESDSDISLSPTRLDLTVQEILHFY